MSFYCEYFTNNRLFSEYTMHIEFYIIMNLCTITQYANFVLILGVILIIVLLILITRERRCLHIEENFQHQGKDRFTPKKKGNPDPSYVKSYSRQLTLEEDSDDSGVYVVDKEAVKSFTHDKLLSEYRNDERPK